MRAGLFTIPCDGCIDYAPILDFVRDSDYRGWLIIEAEQDPAMAPPLATASRAMLGWRTIYLPFIVRGVRIMSARLNIGLIGSGFMGRHTLTLTSRGDVLSRSAQAPASLRAGGSGSGDGRTPRGETGAEKAYGDWRELVNDPQVDVVDITSPNHLHYTMAMAAIAAGKHVY